MPDWKFKSDWTLNPRNPDYQDLQNLMLDQGRAGVGSWGGDVDAGGHGLLNLGALSVGALSVGSLSVGSLSVGALTVEGATAFYSGASGSNLALSLGRTSTEATVAIAAAAGQYAAGASAGDLVIRGESSGSKIVLGLAGANTMTVLNGSVGIGNPSPNHTLGFGYGGMTSDGSSGLGMMSGVYFGAGSWRYFDSVSKPCTIQMQTDGNIVFSSANSTGAAGSVVSGYGEKMRLTPAGYLGIGVTPDVPLHIRAANAYFLKIEGASPAQTWGLGTEGTTGNLLLDNVSAGKRALTVATSNHVCLSVPNSAVADSNLFVSTATIWYDEGNNRLVFRAKNSAGVLKTGYVTVS